MSIQQKNEYDIIENWGHELQLYEGENLYQLLEVVATENNRLDLDIEELYDDKFLSTATGEELEKIGNLVNVERKTAEGDAKLRKRIQAEFAAKASDTTYDMFASIALSILDTTKENITIRTPPETVPKVIELEIDGSILDDNVLTRTEIANLLGKSISASARIEIVEIGSFAFDGDDASLKGWNDGTWSATFS